LGVSIAEKLFDDRTLIIERESGVHQRVKFLLLAVLFAVSAIVGVSSIPVNIVDLNHAKLGAAYEDWLAIKHVPVQVYTGDVEFGLK